MSDPIPEEATANSTSLLSSTTRFCCCFPCFGSRRSPSYSSPSSSSLWDPPQSPPPGSWRSRSIGAFMKVREWSELAAGPKWKTFIRRFNRGNNSRSSSGGKFQYDPLSYALNFDEGPHAAEDDLDAGEFSGFSSSSSRYAAASATGGGNSFAAVHKEVAVTS